MTRKDNNSKSPDMSLCQSHYGLIGRGIGYSFSPAYFKRKFHELGLQSTHSYSLFDCSTEEEVDRILSEGLFHGCNVTQPYKRYVAARCDVLHGAAHLLNAVNVIIRRSDALHGYNTDVIGLMTEMVHLEYHSASDQIAHWRSRPVYVLGSGGAALAASYVYHRLGYAVRLVSRSVDRGDMIYEDLQALTAKDVGVVVNCTPLGTYPDVSQKPGWPARLYGAKQLYIDLIYNPAQTLLLAEAKHAGATIANGLAMFHRQADASWHIWQHE